MTQKIKTAEKLSTDGSNLTGNKAARAALEKMITPSLPKVSSFKTTKEKLHYVADMIEKQALVEKGIGFNMADYYVSDTHYKDKSGHACGTIACIAGTAMFLEDGKVMVEGRNYLSPAAGLLGILEDDADELFTAGNSMTSLGDVTPEHAVAVIRDFADNGKVRWDHFDENGEPVQ